MQPVFSGRHAAHPVAVPIVHPREVPAMLSQTETQRYYVVVQLYAMYYRHDLPMLENQMC